jgi:hypothetical protein
MIPIGKTIVSDELIEKRFVCDLARCRGACCVEGESGAPLEDDELAPLQENYVNIAPYMTTEGRRAVKEQGLYTVDSDGDNVTPLVGDRGACAYAVFENGIAACAIEKAHAAGRSSFQKPVSCHLYPVRVTKYRNYDAVNYHAWSVCAPACTLGRSLQAPVFRFVAAALVRRFGQAWYDALEKAAEAKRPKRALRKAGPA